MNDENHEEEMPQAQFLQINPQIFEAFQQHADHHAMHAEVVKHDMMDFVRNLDKDQLILMDQFAGMFSAFPDAARYYQGFIAAVLEHKYHICAACHTNHDEAAKDLMDQAAEKHTRPEQMVDEEQKPEVKFDDQIVFEDPSMFTGLERLRVEKHNETQHAAEQAKERHVKAKMEEYNVEPWGDNLLSDQVDVPYPPSAVRCKRCQMQYVSLEDRMLKAPDVTGCDGCIQKTKHG